MQTQTHTQTQIKMPLIKNVCRVNTKTHKLIKKKVKVKVPDASGSPSLLIANFKFDFCLLRLLYFA